MSIRELNDQIEIQGTFYIKVWNDDTCDYKTLVKGTDFEIDRWEIDEDILERKITYMYAVDGILIIEVE